MPADDATLMLAAGQGDRDAFAELVRRYQRPLVQFAYRFQGVDDLDSAEDLAQDCLLAAWRAAPRYTPKAQVKTWLYRILTNLCLNHRRRGQLRETVSLDDESAPEPAGPDTELPERQLLAGETADRIRRAMQQLADQQRAALLLRHYHELPYSDIAEVLQTSVPAVESLLFRARQRLQQILAAEESREPPQVARGAGDEDE